MIEKLVLYSRDKCPLCEKAKLVLEEIEEELGVSYEIIDIYNNDELLNLYGIMIPVVKWKGKVIQYGQINKNKLCQCIKK